MIQRAAASQKRINEFLMRVPNNGSPTNVMKVRLDKEIIMDAVSFTYPESGIQALKEVNLTIKKGERVLLVGKTGCGKSTLLQLLLRFYQPSLGNIYFDQNDISLFKLQDLRAKIGYVSQEVFLFSDTVANNIAFGLLKADIELIKSAAMAAAIDEEIKLFSNGYDTLVGERGVTLSGGQKQRVSLARAFLHNPDILLLDDCLSAVDSQTEQKIAKSLDTFFAGKTILIATHRIPAHLSFDKAVVLEEGRIVEAGNPKDLLAKEGFFKRIVDQQSLEENSDFAKN